jgi:hypothetical protein
VLRKVGGPAAMACSSLSLSSKQVFKKNSRGCCINIRRLESWMPNIKKKLVGKIVCDRHQSTSVSSDSKERKMLQSRKGWKDKDRVEDSSPHHPFI